MPFLRGAHPSRTVSEALKGDEVWRTSLAWLEEHETIDLGNLEFEPHPGCRDY